MRYLGLILFLSLSIYCNSFAQDVWLSVGCQFGGVSEKYSYAPEPEFGLNLSSRNFITPSFGLSMRGLKSFRFDLRYRSLKSEIQNYSRRRTFDNTDIHHRYTIYQNFFNLESCYQIPVGDFLFGIGSFFAIRTNSKEKFTKILFKRLYAPYREITEETVIQSNLPRTSWYDIGLIFAFSYNLNENLLLDAKLQQGLIDQFVNTNGIDKKNLFTGFFLGVKYRVKGLSGKKTLKD